MALEKLDLLHSKNVLRQILGKYRDFHRIKGTITIVLHCVSKCAHIWLYIKMFWSTRVQN